MKVTKWVEFSKEIEIDISFTDIQEALAEEFASARSDADPYIPEHRFHLSRALNDLSAFLRALTDEQIKLYGGPAKKLLAGHLRLLADRFEPPVAQESSKEKE